MSSMSSPTVLVQYPPTASNARFENKPNAPEMMNNELNTLKATRPPRKERKYYTT